MLDNFSTWDFAVPGSPKSNTLMSPLMRCLAFTSLAHPPKRLSAMAVFTCWQPYIEGAMELMIRRPIYFVGWRWWIWEIKVLGWGSHCEAKGEWTVVDEFRRCNSAVLVDRKSTCSGRETTEAVLFYWMFKTRGIRWAFPTSLQNENTVITLRVHSCVRITPRNATKGSLPPSTHSFRTST